MESVACDGEPCLFRNRKPYMKCLSHPKLIENIAFVIQSGVLCSLSGEQKMLFSTSFNIQHLWFETTCSMFKIPNMAMEQLRSGDNYMRMQSNLESKLKFLFSFMQYFLCPWRSIIMSNGYISKCEFILYHF